MKSSAIVRIVAWSLVALFLIGALTSVLLGGNVFGIKLHLGNNIMTNFKYPDSNRYSVGNGSVSGTGVHNIEVDWVAGSVEVIAYDGNDIEFSETAKRSLKEKERLHYYLKGDTLMLRYSAPQRIPINFGNSIPSKDLTVKVPSSILKDLQNLDVSGVSSALKIDGVSAYAVDVESVSGSVYLNNIESYSVDIESVSGGIEATNVTAREINTESVSGKTNIAGSFHEVDCNTVSGKVVIDSSICPSAIDVESVSGGIRVIIPENDGFTANLDSVSGSINCTFPTTGSKKVAVYKNGLAEFDFESVSGGITIEQK